MTKKIFPLWADDSDIKKIKQRAKLARQSTSQFILKKALATPNISTGDWWDNSDEIIQAIKELKKKEARNK